MQIIKEENYKIKDISVNTIRYTEYFVSVRSQAEYKADKCFICDKAFKIGDNMHLLFIEGSTNKMCCMECAEGIL